MSVSGCYRYWYRYGWNSVTPPIGSTSLRVQRVESIESRLGRQCVECKGNFQTILKLPSTRSLLHHVARLHQAAHLQCTSHRTLCTPQSTWHMPTCIVPSIRCCINHLCGSASSTSPRTCRTQRQHSHSHSGVLQPSLKVQCSEAKIEYKYDKDRRATRCRSSKIT